MPLSAAAAIARAGAAPATTGSIARPEKDLGANFADSLKNLLDGVEETSGAANGAVANMVDGTGDVHDAMIALQRAEMSLELTVQIRNKFVQAYQDVMRMPI
jgi:flagellar hook-basal body complex protein FliE